MGKIAKRYTFAGLQIAVENPAGSERAWPGDGGVEKKTTMRHDYGYIEGALGVDGDEVDCYIGPNPEARFAYVVHQLKRPGYDRPDEDKCFLGFASEADAKAAFLAHRDDGDLAYGGMSAIPIGEFVRKVEARTGSGKIRHDLDAPPAKIAEAWMKQLVDNLLGHGRVKAIAMDSLQVLEIAVGRSQRFDAGPASGFVRAGVWDRGATYGDKLKDGAAADFSVATFGQMLENWLKRGEKISLCYNHQSAYVAQNGQPAPALAQYDAMAIIANGQVVRFEKLAASGAQSPSIADLSASVAQLATSIDPEPSPDGLWFYRGVVTEIGQQLLSGFSYISPMFVPNGKDEQGNEQGYTLIDLAATNTAFQAGCVITFDRASRPTTHQGGSTMAAKLAKMSKFVKFEEGADDEKIKAAVLQKMEEDAKGAMDAGEDFNYEDAAAKLEEMAKHYEDANFEDEDANAEPPHVVMRRYAAKYRKMGKGKEDAPVTADKPHVEPDGDEAYEKAARPRLTALANRLGVKLKPDATSSMMLEAIQAAAVPASSIGEMVKEQVSRALMEREKTQKHADAEQKAKALVVAADKGGFPKENQKSLLAYAITDYEGALVMARSFIGDEAPAHLFSRYTEGGAPIGVDGREAAVPGGKDRRVHRNELATWVIEGERFSKMAQEWADAKDGAVKLEIDGMLGDHEREHPALRLYVANNLLKKKRPDLFAAAEENF